MSEAAASWRGRAIRPCLDLQPIVVPVHFGAAARAALAGRLLRA
jgi:hypothetical protein